MAQPGLAVVVLGKGQVDACLWHNSGGHVPHRFVWRSPHGVQISVTEIEQRFFDLTNEQRRRGRLPPLVEAETLSTAARRHSQDMLRRRFFAHVNPDRKSHADRINAVLRWTAPESAENLWMRSGPMTAASLAGVVDQAVAQLMASDHHRANIMNRRYSHLGIGVALTASEIRVTQLFARFER